MGVLSRRVFGLTVKIVPWLVGPPPEVTPTRVPPSFTMPVGFEPVVEGAVGPQQEVARSNARGGEVEAGDRLDGTGAGGDLEDRSDAVVPIAPGRAEDVAAAVDHDLRQRRGISRRLAERRLDRRGV